MANVVKLKAIGLALLAVFILTACGQKRALYLPKEPVTNNNTSDSKALNESDQQGKD